MILQSSPKLPAAINENGCYFMSLIYLVSQKTEQSFEVKDILRIKRQLIKKGFMDKDCYVDNPQEILSHLGLPTKYTDTHEPPTRKASENEIEILYFRYKEYGHFVAGINGQVAFDPLGMSNSVQLGTLRSKRIFKIL